MNLPLRRLRPLGVLALLTFVSAPAHALLEGTFLYFPSHAPNRSALAEWRIGTGLAGYARIVENPRSAWLVLHGNAGQASDRQYIVDVLPADASVYILEYPGYGLRPGTPSMNAINAAAAEACADVRTRHPAVPLGVLGESLGSGPASFLCSLPNPPDRAVLMVPYDNLLSVAKEHIRYLPVGLLMRDKWDNVKSLSAYAGRVEIFAARHDTVIPVAHARALARSVPHARYVELPCGHNDWSRNPLVRITD
ncbi:MAG TPA: hypothetical protein VIO38_10500 [Rariglobus sp.]